MRSRSARLRQQVRAIDTSRANANNRLVSLWMTRLGDISDPQDLRAAKFFYQDRFHFAMTSFALSVLPVAR